MVENWKKWLLRVVVGLLVAWLVFILARTTWFYFSLHWQAIVFPYTLDYGEGPLLDQAVRLARFENIYHRDLSQPPYTIANYPPLFPLIQAPFVWIFGPALWYGRALSSLSVLLAAIFIGLTIYTLTRRSEAGIVAGLVLLAIPYTLFWGVLNRVDSLALGLSLAALYVVVRWGEKRQGLVGTAILLSLAIFTRQSYALAAPLAAFTWLLRQPARKRAFELALWTGGFTLVLMGGMYLASGGGFFTNIVTANVNPFSWETVRNNFTTIRNQMTVFFLFGIVFLGVGWVRQLRTPAWWLIAPYLVGATLSGMTIGKTGSNINYLMELAAALSLLAGAGLAWSRERRWSIALALVLLVVQVGGLQRWTANDHQGWSKEHLAQTDDQATMDRRIRQAQGVVLADEYMAAVPLAGKPLHFQPFEFKQMVTAGLWDEGPFLEQIRRQQFALIILYDPPSWNSRRERWTPMQLQAIEANYMVDGRWAEALFYIPR